MEIGIHEAKTQLSKLIPAVLSGEEVIITKAGQPLVKLIPVETRSGSRLLGTYKGKVKIHGDLLAPLPDEIIDTFWLKADEEKISS